MAFVGKKVSHKIYGEGTVLADSGLFLKIRFPKFGEKTFEYPMAFIRGLTAIDEETTAIVAADVQVYTDNQKVLQNEKKRLEAQARQLHSDQEELLRMSKGKVSKRANVAFKCNYCDGGQSDEQFGYNGVCSDSIIRLNIETEKKSGCGEETCLCAQYLSGAISDRDTLVKQYEDGDYLCDESRILRDWAIFPGIVQKGTRKGEAMKLQQVQTNSLCVLTTRETGMKEADRFIFAVFLVTKQADNRKDLDGRITTSSEFRIKLSPSEAKNLLYWTFHENTKDPNKAVWGQGLHRYFENEEAAQILYAIRELKKGSEEEELSAKFFQYFCEINNLDSSVLAEPHGALTK